MRAVERWQIQEWKILLQLEGIVLVDSLDGSKGMVGNIMVAQELPATSKALFHQEAHPHNLGTGLTAEMNDATRSMTVCKEIIYKQYPVVDRQKTTVYAYRHIIISGKGPYPRLPRLIHIVGHLLLDKDHRQVHQITGQDSRCDTRSLDSNNLVDALTLEQARKLLGAMHQQLGIKLMIKKTVHKYYASLGFGPAITKYSLF